MFNINYIFTYIITYLLTTSGYEYCKFEKVLCKGKKHIACVPCFREGQMHQPFITNKIREEVLDDHNYFRNQTACGEIYDKNDEKFPQAARMSELAWDYELEYLAKMLVGRCEDIENVCRNTCRFKNVGQNRGVLQPRDGGGEPDFTPLIPFTEQVEFWFEKHVIVDKKNIEKNEISGFAEYMDYILDTQRGSFLLIVNGAAKQVGCAINFCMEDRVWQAHIVCNYSHNLKAHGIVYEIGKAAEKCKKRSSKYSCLCAAEIKDSFASADCEQ